MPNLDRSAAPQDAKRKLHNVPLDREIAEQRSFALHPNLSVVRALRRLRQSGAIKSFMTMFVVRREKKSSLGCNKSSCRKS